MKRTTEKGFTLIELLAIIVILGIIALIAVPTVKRIMDDAKKKAFINSAYGIIKAGDLYYSRKDMLDEIEAIITFGFPNNAEELELDGKLPENGKMIINEDGDIALAIFNEKYCITKTTNADEIIVTENYEVCNIPNPYITSTNACVTSGTCSQADINAGIKVNVKVNAEKAYDFYVIADTGTELTLLMSENLGGNVQWYTSDVNKPGPETALAELALRTNDWTNIAEKTYTVSGLGEDEKTRKYEDKTVTGRARLITYAEANKVGCTTSICPTWMYINLYNTGDDSTYGYWTSTAYAKDSASAWHIKYGGTLGHGNATNSVHGLRPVITISKSL